MLSSNLLGSLAPPDVWLYVRSCLMKPVFGCADGLFFLIRLSAANASRPSPAFKHHNEGQRMKTMSQ